MRNAIYLPEDLIVEILSRVPAVSLARFRSTSKRWNALFKDGRFAKKHFAYAPRQSLVIMLIKFRICLVNLDLRGFNNNNLNPPVKVTSQFSLKDPLSNASEEVDIRKVFHCDGLLLCITNDNRLVVWNLCSGETRWIQPRNLFNRSHYIYAFGKSSCNKYKILRMRLLVNQEVLFSYEYEIYDFCSSSWRVLGVTKDFIIAVAQSHGVFVKGNNYWFGKKQDAKHNVLIAFDFSTEVFRSYSLPNQSTWAGRCVASLSVVREEKLCLLSRVYSQSFSGVRVYSESLDLWMVEPTNLGVMSWTKFLTHKPNYEVHHGVSFVPDEQNKVVVCTDVVKDILHIVAEDRYMQVDHLAAKEFIPIILGYVPTLVQIQEGI